MAWIKKVYLYLVSLISLVIFIFAAIMLINMALKAWVFTKADSNVYYDLPLNCIPPPVNELTGTPASSYSRPPECDMGKADQRSAQRQRDAAQAVAMIIVATPVFLYHWKLARKEA